MGKPNTSAAPKPKTAGGNASVVATKKSANAKPKKTSDLTTIFVGAGFDELEVVNFHFTLDEMKSELDHLFALENLFVLCEETGGKNHLSEHFTKKQKFHTFIAAGTEQFVANLRAGAPSVEKYLVEHKLNWDDLEIRHIYYSENQDCSPSVVAVIRAVGASLVGSHSQKKLVKKLMADTALPKHVLAAEIRAHSASKGDR